MDPGAFIFITHLQHSHLPHASPISHACLPPDTCCCCCCCCTVVAVAAVLALPLLRFSMPYAAAVASSLSSQSIGTAGPMLAASSAAARGPEHNRSGTPRLHSANSTCSTAAQQPPQDVTASSLQSMQLCSFVCAVLHYYKGHECCLLLAPHLRLYKCSCQLPSAQCPRF
jgi:hypothetical protein